MEILNTLTTLLPTLGKVTGRVTFATGTPSLSSLTGIDITDQAQVSVTDTATGVTGLTITNAKGSAGVMLVTSVVPTTPGLLWAASAGTYSGDTGTVSITTFATVTQVATDDNFTFTVEFY